MNILLRILLFFSLIAGELYAFQNELSGYGEYDTGFKLLTLSDFSRSYNNNNKRDIRAYLWYPSQVKSNAKLTIGDFVKFAREDFYPPNDNVDCISKKKDVRITISQRTV